MPISIIAAMSKNKVIGNDNRLPWHLPDDLKHFKKLTLNKPVVMGRKTCDSLKKPLPDRNNIVITRDVNYNPPGFYVVHDFLDGIKDQNNAEIMIIGGAEIFKQALPLADRMYLTLINAEIKGNVYFPEWNSAEWLETESSIHPADATHSYAFRFVTLIRKK